MAELRFSCPCGTITGTLRGAGPATGTHAVCYCGSCRAGEVHAGGADPAPDPVGIFQTTPDRLSIDTGADRLAVFSFGPKNLLRWRADCCGTALFNTPRNPRISFVGIRTPLLDDTAALGPVRGKAFVPKPGGKQGHEGLGPLLLAALVRIVAQRVSGKWRQNPLFDTATGRPIAEIELVPAKVRRGLIPGR